MKTSPGLVLGSYLAICLSVPRVVTAAATAKPDFIKPREILRRGLTNQAYPGCTVIVGTADRILWSEVFGRFAYTNGAQVKLTTVYDLASLTKVVGTTAVYMRLIALGKVNVGEPVSKYLPEFVDAAPDEAERHWRQKLNLEHLLTHSGGLVAWKPFYRSVNSYSELLKAIYATPLEGEPGRQFRYSDLGMILAGEIASRLGAKPLADLERELVFGPLGMTDTLRNPPQNLWLRIPPTERLPDTGELIHGIVHDENARAGQGITGHAGLFSSVDDLGRLAQEWLRGLDARSKLFPKSVVEEFFRERQLGDGSHRTLGWGLKRNKDDSYGPMLSHTGFTGTAIWIDPRRKLYVIFLNNRVHPTRENNKVNQVRKDFIEAVTTAVEQASASKAE
jgi:CubicO group peptidase (beta-lactamase class C family)